MRQGRMLLSAYHTHLYVRYTYIYSNALILRLADVTGVTSVTSEFERSERYQLWLLLVLFAALGPPLDRSWEALGSSWPLLARSWDALCRPGAALGRSWPLLGRSWPLLDRSWGTRNALKVFYSNNVTAEPPSP